MVMPLHESCRKFELKESSLFVECMLADGITWKLATFDLSTCIGNIDGKLTWGKTDFRSSSRDIRLEGTVLIAHCRKAHGSNEWVESRLDLAARIRNDNGILILIESNEKLSKMLTEVPWMKFKVVAEPDFSAFTKHPVMQETMHKIAQSTAEHVSKRMAEIMTAAIAAASVAVYESAMAHVEQSMEVMLSTIGGEAAAATIEHSHTHHGHLYMHGTHHLHHPSIAEPPKQLTL